MSVNRTKKPTENLPALICLFELHKTNLAVNLVQQSLGIGYCLFTAFFQNFFQVGFVGQYGVVSVLDRLQRLVYTAAHSLFQHAVSGTVKFLFNKFEDDYREHIVNAHQV